MGSCGCPSSSAVANVVRFSGSTTESGVEAGTPESWAPQWLERWGPRPHCYCCPVTCGYGCCWVWKAGVMCVISLLRPGSLGLWTQLPQLEAGIKGTASTVPLVLPLLRFPVHPPLHAQIYGILWHPVGLDGSTFDALMVVGKRGETEQVSHFAVLLMSLSQRLVCLPAFSCSFHLSTVLLFWPLSLCYTNTSFLPFACVIHLFGTSPSSPCS